MDYYLKQKQLLGAELYPDSLRHVHSQFAMQALLKEVCLSPKPGLVDMNNTGSHRDMDFTTFIASIRAIAPWLDQFYHYGYAFMDSIEARSHAITSALLSGENNPYFLQGIRPLGIQCEQAMFAATKRVNTHKGGIFAFGLLLSAIGYLQKQSSQLDYQKICRVVATICHGIVDHELTQKVDTSSMGEKLFKRHQLAGARGEAESGYRTVREISLPIYIEMRDKGYDEESSLLQALLYLLAYNPDTNLVARGGLEGLAFVQQAAKQLLRAGGICQTTGRQALYDLDLALIKRNLSPGGSADLIAITWFLAQYQGESSPSQHTPIVYPN
ncbi:triphosphoribosyl-dephospho-CoA synthase CitG [Orbaceae bacterium ESL0727]|nr:triphosphoribosyl-dephospho-CoA synthase CitG [Orbaceae bacterium ESL0727]